MHRRGIQVCVVLVVLGTAGCLGAGTQGAGDAVEPASEDSDEETSYVKLYRFEDALEGTSPPHPLQPGAIAHAGATQTDTFEVPETAQTLRIETAVPHGQGMGKVEIVDPSGEILHATRTYAYAGEPCESSVGVSPDLTETSAGSLTPGTHEVRYYATGTMCFEVSAAATVAS